MSLLVMVVLELAAEALADRAERIELGTQITPTFSEGIWPPGRAPRLVAQWVERGCR